MTFDLETFHEHAVKTPSHKDVEPMRQLVAETLTDAGVDPTVDAAGNLIATKGNGEPHVVLNTHIDTVPPHIPYKRATTVPGTDRQLSVVQGRGACDAKGPLAALLGAFLAVDPDEGQVTLALTPNEETSQEGAAHIKGSLDADAVIVGEPTDLDVCHAARGQFNGSITITGEAAHAAQPNSGINAVAALRPVLEAIESFDRHHGPPEHEELGPPLLTGTVVEGGSADNQIPAHCRLTFDRRSVPPESASGFESTLRTVIQEAVPTGIEVDVGLEKRPAPHLEAFSTPIDSPLVKTMAANTSGTIRPFGAATEASFFASHAPTVVFGPGELTDEHGPVAHADREYISVEQLHQAQSILQTTIPELLDQSSM